MCLNDRICVYLTLSITSTMAPCLRRISTMAKQPLAAAKCSGVDPVVPTVCLCHREEMHARAERWRRWRAKVRQSRSESVHPYMFVLYCLPWMSVRFFSASIFSSASSSRKGLHERRRGKNRAGSRMCVVRYARHRQKGRKTDFRHIRSKRRNDNITYTPFSLLYLRGSRRALTSAPRSIRYRTTATLALLQLAAWMGNTPLTTESIACPLSSANLTRPN